MIERTGDELPLKMQADLLSVSRSSVYYQPRPPSAEEVQLKHRIDEVYTQLPYYGSRKIAAQLHREGKGINRKTVACSMQEIGIAAVYPGPNLSKRNQKEGVYPYLLSFGVGGQPYYNMIVVVLLLEICTYGTLGL